MWLGTTRRLNCECMRDLGRGMVILNGLLQLTIVCVGRRCMLIIQNLYIKIFITNIYIYIFDITSKTFVSE